MNRINILKWLEADTHFIPCETINMAEQDADDGDDEAFPMVECIHCSPEEYQKTIWKNLSSDKTMDDLREILSKDEGFIKYFENGIKENLKQIVDDEGTKSYEDIFTQLGGLDPSKVGDDNLETLIKKSVKANMGSIPPETKEAIFTKWDEQINKNRKQRKN